MSIYILSTQHRFRADAVCNPNNKYEQFSPRKPSTVPTSDVAPTMTLATTAAGAGKSHYMLHPP